MRFPDVFSLSTVLVSAGVSAVTGYFSSRLTQHIQERKTTCRWRLALTSEIRTLRTRLLQYEIAFESRVLTRELSGSQVLRVLLQPGDISVFTHNASAIGFFDNRLALRVLRFYADIRALQSHAIILEETTPRGDTAGSNPQIHTHRKMLRNCKRRAHLLVQRLRNEAAALRFARRVWTKEQRRLRCLLHRAPRREAAGENL